MVNRIQQFLRYREKDQALCTEKEMHILQLYGKRTVKAIAEQSHVTISSIHQVFNRIRRRRDLMQKRERAWSMLCRDPRYQNVLAPKVLPHGED